MKLFNLFKKEPLLEPEMINISMVFLCNLRCKMCYGWKSEGRPDVELNTEDWKRIIRELRQTFKNRIMLAFTGSESLLRKDIFELIEYSESKGFDTWLHTNGFLVTASIAKRLRLAGLKNASISIDSLAPEEHDTMRGVPGSLSRALSAVEHLHNFGVDNININTVICKINLKSIPDLCKYVEKDNRIHAHTLQAISKIFASNEKDDWYKFHPDLWPEDRYEIERVLREIDEKRGKKLVNSKSQLESYSRYFLDPMSSIKHYGCKVGTKQVNIGHLGHVNICPDATSGYLNRASFNSIWNSKANRKIIESMPLCKKNCHTLVNCAYQEETIMN